MNRRNRRSTQILIRSIFMAVTLLLTANAESMIRTLPLDGLIRASDHIVIAQVRSVSVIKTDPETTMSTLRNELKVIEPLKGVWPENTPLVLQTFSAEHWIEDNVALPQPGSKALLFLKKDLQGVLTPVNGIQGIWPMDRNRLLGMGTRYRIEQVREVVQEQTKQQISGEEAEQLIRDLPEVKLRADEIRKSGARPFTMRETKPGPDAEIGKPEAAYHIYFGEDLGTHTVRIMSFLVDACTGGIMVYDVVTDETLPLAEWRKTKQ